MEGTSEPKAYLKWALILVGCLSLLVLNAARHWALATLTAVLSLGIVIGFIYFNEAALVEKVSEFFQERSLNTPKNASAARSVNYTQQDIDYFKKEGMNNRTGDAYRRGIPGHPSDILIDNSRHMKDFHKYAHEVVDNEPEELVLRKDYSFGVPGIQNSDGKGKPKPKTVSFEVGSQVFKDYGNGDLSIPFTDRSAEYRRKQIEELAEYIHTGIMNADKLFKEHKVEYAEPKRHVPAAPAPPVVQKPTTEKPPVPTGLLDLKNKQQKDNVLLAGAIPKDKPAAPEPEKPKISLFKPNGTNLSTITEVQEESMVDRSQIPFESTTTVPIKAASPTVNSRLFDSMAMEQIEAKPTQAGNPLGSSSAGLAQPSIPGLFGQNTAGLNFSQPTETPKPAPASTTGQTGPTGPLELKNPSDTIAKNKELYFNVASHAKDLMKNPHKISEAKKAAIKETVRNFLRDVCSAIDDHFLGECEKIIYEMNQRKNDEDEYLFFCYELVTQFILEYIDLMSSNKVKIIYAAVIFQIISIYHCSIIELIQAIAYRKFPWLRGEKVPVGADLEEYLQKIGFDGIERTIKPKGTSDKDKQDYIKAVAEKIGTKVKKSEGAKAESKFDQFYLRLDFYSLVLFSVLSSDLRVQLRGVNSQVALKYLADYKVVYEQMYFEMLNKIISATPVQFRPLILRNWINVSSDLWTTHSNQMLQIIRHIDSREMKTIETHVIAADAQFHVFSQKSVIMELRNTAIGLREDLKFILKEQSIKSKDKIFDPDR